MGKQSKQRFSHTVENYRKYRPDYPKEVITWLESAGALTPNSIVADIGYGTGIFTKLLLEQGNTVYAIEPNAEMREAGEDFLKDYPNLKSMAGDSEHTTLPDQSIDLITAAQAFHWFNVETTKLEFKRILKPEGFVLLIWNLRDNCNAFMQAYEHFLVEFGTDYQNVAAEGIEEAGIKQFFRPAPVTIHSFPNTQIFDWDGFKGRILSCSYIPKPDAPNFEAMLASARQLFNNHAKNGLITFHYQTKSYLAHIA